MLAACVPLIASVMPNAAPVPPLPVKQSNPDGTRSMHAAVPRDASKISATRFRSPGPICDLRYIRAPEASVKRR